MTAAYPDILALGEAMIELNQKGARDFLQGFGGDTSNFVIAAARSGASTGYISAVGNDEFGHLLRDLWATEKIDTRGVSTDSDAFTGLYIVTHDEKGHHFSFYRKGSAASRLRPQNLPLDLIRNAKFLHLSGISFAISSEACDTAYAGIAEAKAAGIRISFDTNLRLRLWSKDRARAVISDVIGMADICLPSYDDIVDLTGITDPDAIIDFCLARGAGTVALKLGAKGTLVAFDGQRIAVPPHPCKPVDATGAGDCFGGTFVARIVAGDDPVAAARYAATAAALSTEGYGAVEPIPSAERIQAAMAARKGA